MNGGLYHFWLILCPYFPHHFPERSEYPHAVNTMNFPSIQRVWLAKLWQGRLKLTIWSTLWGLLLIQLVLYQAHTGPVTFSPVSSRVEASSSKVMSHSQNKGHCTAILFHIFLDAVYLCRAFVLPFQMLPLIGIRLLLKLTFLMPNWLTGQS